MNFPSIKTIGNEYPEARNGVGFSPASVSKPLKEHLAQGLALKPHDSVLISDLDGRGGPADFQTYLDFDPSGKASVVVVNKHEGGAIATTEVPINYSRGGESVPQRIPLNSPFTTYHSVEITEVGENARFCTEISLNGRLGSSRLNLWNSEPQRPQ